MRKAARISRLVARLASPSVELDRLDLAFLAALAAYALLRILAFDPVQFLDFQDMGSYRRLAEDPWTYFSGVPAHHAQRVLPSLVVWAANRLVGLPIDDGFRALSGLAFLLAHTLLFVVLRRLNLSPLLAFTATILAATAQWPVDYSLRNVWQATDAWTYALSILMVLLCLERRIGPLILVAVLSVFVRQNLPILGVAALFHLYLTSQRRGLPLVGIAAVILVFILDMQLAGEQGQSVIRQHLTGDLVSTSGLIALAFDMRLPWMLLPFLPLYATPAAIRSLARLWWIAVFSLATAGQALLVAEAGGVENTQRLVMPAFWILVPLAGVAAGNLFSGVRAQLLFALLPASLVLSRLLLHETSLQAWHTHRVVPGLLLAMLILWAHLVPKAAGGSGGVGRQDA